MRSSMIAGIVLLIAGAFVLVRGGTFTTKKDLVKIGDVKITADEKQSIPTWAGAAGVVAGVVLIVAGARKRN